MKYERVFMINERGWSNGTWEGFCSIATQPWGDGVRVWRLVATNRVRLQLCWNLQSSAIAAALTTSESSIA